MTGLPLSPHCNPPPALLKDSLGVFRNRTNRLLASFAGLVSPGDHAFSLAGEKTCSSLIRQIHSRQATLHTAEFLYRIAGSIPTRRLSAVLYERPVTHSIGSPRQLGRSRMPLRCALGALTPSIHPKLGVMSKHQGLHRYALQRIFRPVLGAGGSD